MAIDVFAVVADGTRRGILTVLRTGDRPVGELVTELGVPQPTVSKHLKILREAGLVTMRAHGQKRFYALDPEPLEEIAGWLESFGLALQPVVPDATRPGAQHGGPAPRTVGRAAERAADLLSQIPRLRRRRD
jgi:DNA-binding transcriptional ArsR family regulator